LLIQYSFIHFALQLSLSSDTGRTRALSLSKHGRFWRLMLPLKYFEIKYWSDVYVILVSCLLQFICYGLSWYFCYRWFLFLCQLIFSYLHVIVMSGFFFIYILVSELLQFQFPRLFMVNICDFGCILARVYSSMLTASGSPWLHHLVLLRVVIRPYAVSFGYLKLAIHVRPVSNNTMSEFISNFC
jgi:hypothetical protein